MRLTIAQLSPQDVEIVGKVATGLRELIRRFGPYAHMAIALVGAEEAAKHGGYPPESQSATPVAPAVRAPEAQTGPAEG